MGVCPQAAPLRAVFDAKRAPALGYCVHPMHALMRLLRLARQTKWPRGVKLARLVD